jgi:hypothetical protein
VSNKEQSVSFSLTWTNKIIYMTVPLFLSIIILLYGPIITAAGIIGNVGFILLAILLGLVTFFISAGWSFQLEISPALIRMRDRRQDIAIPMDKVGLLVRNGGLPFPMVWVILRGAAGVGQEIPEKGVDSRAREMIEQFSRRNPGKRLTYVPVNGGYLRSVDQFAATVKRLAPPVTVDERLGAK